MCCFFFWSCGFFFIMRKIRAMANVVVDIHMKAMYVQKMLFGTAPVAEEAKEHVSSNKEGRKVLPSTNSNVEEDKLFLPFAEFGKVVTRFPPEASGFLHIGHAKAALVNRMIATKYGGKMIFRFDDTNPDKEKHHFEKVIVEDLATLGVQWDVGPTYSSDLMDVYIAKAHELLEKELAYCDTTNREEMQRLRFDGVATTCRNNTKDENWRLWAEMQKGSQEGQTACLRAKISISAENKALRDPVLFRCNLSAHARQGRKYNAYPTYDFCCPIIDSVEGVTHALRTNEYHDRNDQYYWILDALQMRKPIIEDFSRLNMEYAVMSKRKLTQLVLDKVVDGWDDPRFPTVRALVRRGLKVDALKEFVKVQGMSKAVNFMEWSKLWNFNVQILDPSVPRYSCVNADLCVRCVIPELTADVNDVSVTRPRHKKNVSLGDKTFFRANNILLDAEDVALLANGDEVTLVDWGNAIVSCLQANTSGVPTHCTLTLNLLGDVKSTKYKLTWVADTSRSVPFIINEYDHLLTKKKPDPEESIDNLIAPVTKFTMNATGEAALGELKAGDFLQLERRGYYVVDTVSPLLTLINIPDGRGKVSHLSAKHQFLKTLPQQDAPTTKGTSVAIGGGGSVALSLEEKKAQKAAKKAVNGIEKTKK